MAVRETTLGRWPISFRKKRRESVAQTSDELDAALMQAAIEGSLERVRRLEAQGANRHTRHSSAMLDNHVSYDRDAFDTPLEAACWQGHTDIVAHFLKKDRSCRRRFNRSNRAISKEEKENMLIDQETFLMACQGGTLATVKCFVEHFGPSIVLREYGKTTPLHHACARCHLPMIKYLISQGARLDKPTQRGGAPAIHWLGMLVEMKLIHEEPPIPLPNDDYLTQESYESSIAWIIRNYSEAILVPDSRGTTALQRILKNASLDVLRTAVVELAAIGRRE